MAAVIEKTSFVAQRTKNFAASFAFTSAAFLIYRFSPHVARLRDAWSDDFGMSGADVLTFGYLAYSALLLLFYATEAFPRDAKSVAALRALSAMAASPLCVWREGLPREDRLGLLVVAVKVFFAPLMVLSLFDYVGKIFANGAYLFGHLTLAGSGFLDLFNSHGFWFLLQLIVLVDVGCFALGYLIELPALKNEIRSVDSTLLGWGVTLACYPPFNAITAWLIGGNTVTFPHFENPTVHVAINVMVLILMAVYASASVALNVKGSNLTHRGIVSSGPYRFIRHPAYTCKNLAWWLGTLPALGVAWQHSPWETLLVVGSALAWSMVYMMRALTEEDHLRRVDGEYGAYCRKVPYRFIPGIY